MKARTDEKNGASFAKRTGRTAQTEGSTNTEPRGAEGPMMRDHVNHGREFGFHSKNNGKPFKVLKQGRAIIQ